MVEKFIDGECAQQYTDSMDGGAKIVGQLLNNPQ
jgi:hypothetical protein